MQVKRFFAADMRQAMKLVRDELGPDAAILSNRRVAGGVELTAALDYQAPAPAAPNAELQAELRKTHAKIARPMPTSASARRACLGRTQGQAAARRHQRRRQPSRAGDRPAACAPAGRRRPAASAAPEDRRAWKPCAANSAAA